MSLAMRRLVTTLWIGKVFVGLFFLPALGEESGAALDRPGAVAPVPALDSTLRHHHPYPE